MLGFITEALGLNPKIKFGSDRPGHDRAYRMVNTKIEYSVTPLKEAVRKTVEWYTKNRAWWEPLLEDRFFTEDEPWRIGNT